MEPLSFEEVQIILLANGDKNRKPSASSSEKHLKSLRVKAEKNLQNWITDGVPSPAWLYLLRSNSSLLSEYSLKQQIVTPPVIKTPPRQVLRANLEGSDTFTVFTWHNDENNGPVFDENLFIPPVEESVEYCYSNHQRQKKLSEGTAHPISFLRLLQHWAIKTRQKNTNLDLFLRLMKHHKPVVDYDVLPGTGKQLLKIDGRDYCGFNPPIQFASTSVSADSTVRTASRSVSVTSIARGLRRKRFPLPIPTIQRQGAKYTHFGLAAAITGTSIGLLYKDVVLLQYISIYKTNPDLIPPQILKKIEALDGCEVLRKAREALRKEPEAATQLPVFTTDAVPPTLKKLHYEVDVHADGVEVFECSEQASVTAILGRLHSVKSSFDSTEEPISFDCSKPFIIGFEHGKHKGSAQELMRSLIEELKFLCPHNSASTEREFTVSLRVVIADTPMREFLKRIIAFMGYWACERCIQRGIRLVDKDGNTSIIQLLETDCCRRNDDDWLSYVTNDKKDKSQDNHVNGLHDLSPFCEINFPMVTGFVLDTMHTMWLGNLGRYLRNMALVSKEGKLSALQLARVDARLKIVGDCNPYEFNGKLGSLSKSANKFKTHEIRRFGYLLYPIFKDILDDSYLQHIMRLPYAVQLLGGFNKNPTPPENIEKARTVLKDFIVEHKRLGYPVRFVNHEILHLPDDATTYKCGIERNSAFEFENFLRWFGLLINSGHLPSEQIRNRLIQMNKYALTTGRDGRILSSFDEFEREADLLKSINSQTNVFIKCTMSSVLKKLVFSTFVLSNRFPNNVFVSKDNAIIVCQDIIEYPMCSDNYVIVGRKFCSKRDAFLLPYNSSDFDSYVVSKLNKDVDEWDFNLIKGKMCAIPNKFNPFQCGNVLSPLPDILELNSNREWFVSAIQHTVF